jgi:putative acetyltransferase
MEAPFRALALAPLSVDPGAQGRGVGSALVREALRVARRSGWAGVFVLGAPAYYRRFGFDATTAAGFLSPYAGEHFMALILADGPAAHSGRLRHAPAFGALE